MGTLIAILFPIGIGLYWITQNLFALTKSIRSSRWPMVEGVITESYLGAEQRDPKSELYEPVVRYKYFVGGTGYVGRRMDWGSLKTREKEKIHRQLQPYPEGSRIPVHFNPSNPWESVLEPRAPGVFVRFLAGFVFLVIGITIGSSCISGSWCPDIPLGEALEILAD